MPAPRSALVPMLAPAGNPDEAAACGMVASLADAGFDQFLLYPSTGLGWPYLGEVFFRMAEAMASEAARRGMGLWLYDEFNWPSGSAFGRVPEEDPRCLYRELVAVRGAGGEISWRLLESREKNVDNGRLDTNNLEPDGVRRFMALTHRAYERRLRPYFDGTIRGIFSDEPGHCSGAWSLRVPPGTALRLPWWSGMEEEYREACGGDFRADVAAALRGGAPERAEALRRWTALRSRRYRAAYFDPIAAWCRSLGIESTGHLVSEGDPSRCAVVNGNPLDTLCGFTKPGIDLVSSATGPDFEFLTLALADAAARRVGRPGSAELFALGPSDLPFSQMRKMVWLAALHRIDTYFLAVSHRSAVRFASKPAWAMFFSPDQPWFGSLAPLHAEAARAAEWARKPRPAPTLAVVYPQRAAGAAGLAGVAPPPLAALCAALSWRQFDYALVAEDEPRAAPVTIDWDGDVPFDRASGTRFRNVAACVAALGRRFADRPALRAPDGSVREGVAFRSFADGTGVGVDLATGEVEMRKAECGTHNAERAMPIGAREADLVVSASCIHRYELALSSPSVKRLWFRPPENAVAFEVLAPLPTVRFARRTLPAGAAARVLLDGCELAFDRPCRGVAPAYDGLYRETAPLDLAPGLHRLAVEGLRDGWLFLPALWLVGAFAEPRPGAFGPVPETVGPGSLASQGLGSFAGTATYRARAAFALGARLALDTGGALARVRFAGRDLGTRAWAPFEWEIPADLSGAPHPLEIDLFTSIRPIFGSETDPSAALDHGLWGASTFASPAPAGLRRAEILPGGPA